VRDTRQHKGSLVDQSRDAVLHIVERAGERADLTAALRFDIVGVKVSAHRLNTTRQSLERSRRLP